MRVLLRLSQNLQCLHPNQLQLFLHLCRLLLLLYPLCHHQNLWHLFQSLPMMTRKEEEPKMKNAKFVGVMSKLTQWMSLMCASHKRTTKAELRRTKTQNQLLQPNL